MLDDTPGGRGMVPDMARTTTAAAMHEATSLVAAAHVLPSVQEQSYVRPFGTLGNLDREIQKPCRNW